MTTRFSFIPVFFGIALMGALAHASTPPSSAPAEEIMAWCSSWISDLQNARWNAQLEASNGNLGGAADHLQATLTEKASNIGNGDFSPTPHTADAIRVGAAVVREAFSAAAHEMLPPRLSDQLRYIVADNTYALIEWAYFQLDDRYYRDVFETCHRPGRRCNDGDPMRFLPPGYFDGVRQLGLQFMNMQIDLSRIEASDAIELRLSKVVAQGARDILMSSLYRRGLACPISKLEFAVSQIDSYLCGTTNLTRPQQVGIVRRLMTDARNSIAESTCGAYPAK